MNARANHPTSEEVNQLETIIQRILNRKVFDSVVFNPNKILNSNDMSSTTKSQLIKDEYDKAVKKVNTIYDDTRNALEEYSRTKVNAMKIKEPQGKGTKSSKTSSALQETNIVNITNDHQEKLNILRKLYEEELRLLEKVSIN